MAFALARYADAPWAGRDGHMMVAAKLGAPAPQLIVGGGWAPPESAATRRDFPNTRSNDLWSTASRATLKIGLWNELIREAPWEPRHNFCYGEDERGRLHLALGDPQFGFYKGDHWIGAYPASWKRQRPTNAFGTLPGGMQRVLGIPAVIPPLAADTSSDFLVLGGETLPGSIGPEEEGHAEQRFTSVFGYRNSDGQWREVIANCPALPRSCVNKAVVHEAGGVKYLYLFTGGDYAQKALDSRVWRCRVDLISDAGSWQLVNAAAPWVGRTYAAIASCYGMLWVIGGSHLGAPGSTAAGNRGDIWYSPDHGVTWIEAPFTIPPRHAHGAEPFDGVLAISGGSRDDARLNDVWVIEDV